MKIYAACFLLLTVAAAADNPSPKEVKIGEWTIAESYEGRFQATAPDSLPIEIEVIPDGQDAKVPQGARELDVAGVGRVYAFVGAFVMQTQNLTFNVQMNKEFYCPNAGHWLVLKSRYRPEAPSRKATEQAGQGPHLIGRPTEKDVKEFVAKTEADVLSTIENDPAIGLMKNMVREEIVLGYRAYATDQPTAEAAVDGATFLRLKYSGVLKGADYGWTLSAQPGQRVVFRFTYPCVRAVVTTHGIRVTEDPSALRGEKVRLRAYPPGHARDLTPDYPWIESAIDEKGIAVVDCGVLESPRLLQMQQGLLKQNCRFRHIFLRWGRPEEAWLDNLYFPLTPPASDQTDDLIRAVMNHLEASYDEDRGEFLDRRCNETVVPATEGLNALEGLALAEWPHLASAERQDNPRKWLKRVFGPVLDPETESALEGRDLSMAGLILNAAQSPKYMAKLWEDLPGYKDTPSGWHDPDVVYGLAVLWERFPDLREKNVLERVLDYWVDAIAARPQPVRIEHKTWTSIDYRADKLGYAVAALHLGHRAFGKRDYVVARDTVLDAMRHLGLNSPDRPYYAAMVDRSWWRSAPDRAGSDDAQRMYEFATVYGQTCAFIGDDTELEKVRAWFRWAVMREGNVQDSPFPGDTSPTFSQRCGTISVLRGRADYLAAPELGQ